MHLSSTVPSLRVAVLTRMLGDLSSSEPLGRVIQELIAPGDRRQRCSIIEFEDLGAAEAAAKRLKGKYYHELPRGGGAVVRVAEFLGSARAPCYRQFFVRWTRLYERQEDRLTVFQKNCFDILARIQWRALPADLASGVRVVENFITAEEERQLLAFIDAQPWIDNLKRRVQHYGHQFLYDQLYIDKRPAPRPIPEQVTSMLFAKLRHTIGWTPDQLTVNEYQPGQGIGFHVDTHSAFTEGIAVVSLGGDIDMTFRRPSSGDSLDAERHVRVRSRSCLLFENIARYNWLHGIKSRKSDWDLETGEVIMRTRRVSLTFRLLNWSGEFKCLNCSCPNLCDTQNPASLVLPDRLGADPAASSPA